MRKFKSHDFDGFEAKAARLGRFCCAARFYMGTLFPPDLEAVIFSKCAR